MDERERMLAMKHKTDEELEQGLAKYEKALSILNYEKCKTIREFDLKLTPIVSKLVDFELEITRRKLERGELNV